MGYPLSQAAKDAASLVLVLVAGRDGREDLSLLFSAAVLMVSTGASPRGGRPVVL